MVHIDSKVRFAEINITKMLADIHTGTQTLHELRSEIMNTPVSELKKHPDYGQFAYKQKTKRKLWGLISYEETEARDDFNFLSQIFVEKVRSINTHILESSSNKKNGDERIETPEDNYVIGQLACFPIEFTDQESMIRAFENTIDTYKTSETLLRDMAKYSSFVHTLPKKINQIVLNKNVVFIDVSDISLVEGSYMLQQLVESFNIFNSLLIGDSKDIDERVVFESPYKTVKETIIIGFTLKFEKNIEEEFLLRYLT